MPTGDPQPYEPGTSHLDRLWSAPVTDTSAQFSAISSRTTSTWERWRWLASTYDLQRDYYEVDWQRMDHDLKYRSDYFRTNIAAIASELGEFSNEVGWKPWDDEPGWIKEGAVKELVDLVHFVANLLCALGVTDDEWEARYQAKQEQNRRRKSGHYSAQQNKCPGCGRAIDDGTELVGGEDLRKPWNPHGGTQESIWMASGNRVFLCACGKTNPLL